MIDNITNEAAHCSTEAHRGHEMKTVHVTLSVFAMEIVGTLLSIPGLKLNAVEHPRPTHQQRPGRLFPFQVRSFNNS